VIILEEKINKWKDKALGGKPLSVDDVHEIKLFYQSFTEEQSADITNILKSEVEVKIKNYKYRTGLDPIINPLEDIAPNDNRLEPYLRAWFLSEYLMRQEEIWEKFGKKEIDYDNVLESCVSEWNNLYSLIIS